MNSSGIVIIDHQKPELSSNEQQEAITHLSSIHPVSRRTRSLAASEPSTFVTIVSEQLLQMSRVKFAPYITKLCSEINFHSSTFIFLEFWQDAKVLNLSSDQVKFCNGKYESKTYSYYESLWTANIVLCFIHVLGRNVDLYIYLKIKYLNQQFYPNLHRITIFLVFCWHPNYMLFSRNLLWMLTIN